MDVIYHYGCVDGFTAAYCVWLKHPGATFHEGKFGTPPPELKPGAEVMIVDFSYSRDELLRLARTAKSVVILDHHITAQEHLVDLPPNCTCVFDMERSGASITWDYLFENSERTPLIEYVQDNDLWTRALPGTLAVAAYMRSREMDFQTWLKLDGLLQRDMTRVLDLGQAILARQEQIIAETICNARDFVVEGYAVKGVASPYSLGSEIAGRLAVGKPFGLYYVDKPNERLFGLRSAEDGIDVAHLAERFGGGGHKHAAGFRVPIDHPLAKV